MKRRAVLILIIAWALTVPTVTYAGDEPLIALAWRADGVILAVANLEEAWLYTTEGQPITQLKIDAEQAPYYLEWHPTDNKLALGTTSRTGDERVYVWDISGDPENLNITLERVIVESPIGLGGIAWSPDSRLAVSYGPSEIDVWDTADGSLQQTLSFEENAAVDGIAWSADGQYLAAGVSDGNVRIWDMTSYPYQLIYTLNNEGAGAAGEVAWSPSNSAVAVDQTEGIFIWEYDPVTMSYQQTTTLSESTEIVTRLKWGSNRLVALAADHTVYVWNSTSWELEASFQGGGGSGSVLALAVSPDGSHVAYSGPDGSLTIATLSLQ